MTAKLYPAARHKAEHPRRSRGRRPRARCCRARAGQRVRWGPRRYGQQGADRLPAGAPGTARPGWPPYQGPRPPRRSSSRPAGRRSWRWAASLATTPRRPWPSFSRYDQAGPAALRAHRWRRYRWQGRHRRHRPGGPVGGAELHRGEPLRLRSILSHGHGRWRAGPLPLRIAGATRASWAACGTWKWTP